MDQASSYGVARRRQGLGLWLARLLLAGLLLAGLALLGRSGPQLSALLAHPYPNDGLEGTLLHEARLTAAGIQLYQPLQRYGFVSAPYMPLHTLMVGWADRLHQGPHIFWSARLVSALAALGVALLLLAIVRHMVSWDPASGWLAGGLGALLLLSAPPLVLWASRIKPDLLALFWALLGMYCALRAQGAPEPGEPWQPRHWSSGGSYRYLVASALGFMLAFFTKQTALAALAASGLGLLSADLLAWRRGVRAGYLGRLPIHRWTLGFGLMSLGGILALWLALGLATDGQLAGHVLGLHSTSWWSWLLVRKYAALLLPYWPLMLLSLLSVLAAWRRASSRPGGLILAWYALISPFTLLGAAELSANHNHLLEPLLALTLVGSLALGTLAQLLAPAGVRPSSGDEVVPRGEDEQRWDLASRRGRRVWLALPAFALAALQLWLAFQPQEWFEGELSPGPSLERFVIFMRHTPGEILADDVGLLLLAGKPVRYDDPSTQGPAAWSGVWDDSGLREEIAQGRFSAIMIPDDISEDPYDGIGRWTSQMRAAMRLRYKLAFRDSIFTYVPQ